jgi:hypothetical protein
VVVLALGVPEADYEGELQRALAEAGKPPERVLVITDRLDFTPLLAAGVGFEHVPADGERQPELSADGYSRFRDRRIELIRARRPRPSRVIELP